MFACCFDMKWQGVVGPRGSLGGCHCHRPIFMNMGDGGYGVTFPRIVIAFAGSDLPTWQKWWEPSCSITNMVPQFATDGVGVGVRLGVLPSEADDHTLPAPKKDDIWGEVLPGYIPTKSTSSRCSSHQFRRFWNFTPKNKSTNGIFECLCDPIRLGLVISTPSHEG